jgi:YHS domain-containing protein
MKKMLLIVLVSLSSLALHAQKAEVFSKDGVAINGYDAVAYFTKSQPVKGDKKFLLVWNNATWYFASQEDLNLFQASPEKYAPQYGGYCAYGLSENHKAPTKPEAWSIVNGKLYLNYNLDIKQDWQKNTGERIKKADAYWPAIKNKE